MKHPTAPERRRLAGMLAALVAGAIAGGLLIVHARSYAPLIPLLATALVLTIAAIAEDARCPRREGARARRA
jgi:uncharacterized membrane protein YoaK (UPF0700 family)